MFSFLRLALSVCFVILAIVSETSSKRAQEDVEQGRIINGFEAKEADWPFMAAFGKILPNGSYSHQCGGSIWNEDTIVTAAHCLQVFDVKRDKLVVYIAHSDVSDSALKQNADYLFNVQAFTFHPKFRNRNRRDVGIIKLTEKIDFKGKHRKARCVCEPEPITSVDYANCRIAGWGSTNPYQIHLIFPTKLMQLNMPILYNDSYCVENSPWFRPDDQFCTSRMEWFPRIRFWGLCNGDSGGPLVCPHKQYPQAAILLGIARTSLRNCSGVATYTQALKYLSWINKEAGETVVIGSSSSSIGRLFIDGAFLVVAVIVGGLIGWTLARETESDAQEDEDKKKQKQIGTPVTTETSTMVSEKQTDGKALGDASK